MSVTPDPRTLISGAPTRPAAASRAEARALTINGGLLAYMFDTDSAKKVADLKNKDGSPAIEFLQPDGTYKSGADAVTAESIRNVKIGNQHFALIHSEYDKSTEGNRRSDFKGNAWMKTEPGKNGKCERGGEVIVCYGGFAGDQDKLMGIATGSIAPTTGDEQAIRDTFTGGLNQQTAKVKDFIEKVKTEAATRNDNKAPAKWETYGHSNGAACALLSHCHTGGNVDCVEPFRASQQIPLMAKAYGFSEDMYKAGATSVFAARHGDRDKTVAAALSASPGEQLLVNTDGVVQETGDAAKDIAARHNAANTSLSATQNGLVADPTAAGAGATARPEASPKPEGKPEQVSAGPDDQTEASKKKPFEGNSVIGILMSLLGGQDMFSMFESIMKSFQDYEKKNTKPAAPPPPSPGDNFTPSATPVTKPAGPDAGVEAPSR